MQGRFHRAGKHRISPFFAFQDIITSAIAILIVIVMLLALSVNNSTPETKSDQATENLQNQLKMVLDELDRINAEVRNLQASLNQEIKDPAVLKGRIEALRRDLAAIQAKTREKTTQLQNLQANGVTAATRAEIEKKKAATNAVAQQIAKLEEEAAKSLAAMNKLENLARDKEAQLLAEKAKKNQVTLIPDRSNSSKEPILVIVSEREIAIQRFDRPEKESLKGRGVVSDFGKALKNYSKLDQYIVFYFKPSGADKFESLTENAKDAGFDIGYDAIGEDVEINFSSAR